MGQEAPGEKRGRHMNTVFSYPWNSSGRQQPTSRSYILGGITPTAFGQDQHMNAAVENGPGGSFNPRKWPNAGKTLKVPRCVILSSMPLWSLYYPSSYFYWPRDVIGTLITNTSLLGNYYYFDQWNDPYPSQIIQDTDDYNGREDELGSSAFWDQFDPPVPKDLQDIFTSRYQEMFNDLPPSPRNTLQDGNGAAIARFHQVVGRQAGAYYEQHNAILDTYEEVARRLAALPEPIYTIIPPWFPRQLEQTRNGYLQRGYGYRSGMSRDCQFKDAVACYTDAYKPWGPAYPKGDSPANFMPFIGGIVPWLTNVDPGFGTNTLHIYVGHSNVSYFNSNNLFIYQSFPFTPEGEFFGPILLSNYLGPVVLPFFAGRRPIWRDYGYDIGFTGPGGSRTVYNWYSGLIKDAADNYKKNFWKYRNFGTRIFTYPRSQPVQWNPQVIWADQKEECPSTKFYFGFDTFGEWARTVEGEDARAFPCPGDLKIANTVDKFPSSQSIREAIRDFFPPLQRRVDNYYGGIETGCSDVFNYSIGNNNLSDFNVEHPGNFAEMMDPDALVEYILDYFGQSR